MSIFSYLKSTSCRRDRSKAALRSRVAGKGGWIDREDVEMINDK